MSTKRNAASPGAVRADDVHETRHHHEAGTDSIAATADTVTQMRRRRAASRHLPVLDHGTGDPLDTYGRVPPTLPSTIAARRAWCHLRDHGLLDSDGWLGDVLAEGAA